MRFKFKHKVGFAFSMIRVQFPVKLCYAMTVNKSQSQSFLQALFDTTVESFGHGQSYVALSRIRFYNMIRLIISEENLIEKDEQYIPTLLNCVYPSVILKNNDGEHEDDNDIENDLFYSDLRNINISENSFHVNNYIEDTNNDDADDFVAFVTNNIEFNDANEEYDTNYDDESSDDEDTKSND